jgi:hypothetical protein
MFSHLIEPTFSEKEYLVAFISGSNELGKVFQKWYTFISVGVSSHIFGFVLYFGSDPGSLYYTKINYSSKVFWSEHMGETSYVLRIDVFSGQE